MLRLLCVLTGGVGQLLVVTSLRGVVALTRCAPYYTFGTSTNGTAMATEGTDTDTPWNRPFINETAAATGGGGGGDDGVNVPELAEFIASDLWTCDLPDLVGAGYKRATSRDECLAAGQAVGPPVVGEENVTVVIANTPTQSVAGVDVAGCVASSDGQLYFHDIPYVADVVTVANAGAVARRTFMLTRSSVFVISQ